MNMNMATAWMPWITKYSAPPAETFFVRPGAVARTPVGGGPPEPNEHEWLVGRVDGKRRINMMLSSEQRDAVSRSSGGMLFKHKAQEDPGRTAPIVHTSNIYDDGDRFKEMIKMISWGCNNSVVNERYRNYYRFVYSNLHKRIVMQLTLDVSDDPELHNIINDLVSSDLPQFAKDSFSMREQVMAKRPLDPGDLPYVTFDIASLPYLQSLPILSWKAHHVGSKPNTRLGRKIPLVEPVAVWNYEASEAPIKAVSLGAYNSIIPGNTIGHVNWAPPPGFAFTAAHVAAITESGVLFTTEVDTLVCDGRQGEPVNTDINETGPYANFAFVGGNHCDATLDRVIYGVHSASWCAQQSEKLKNYRASARRMENAMQEDREDAAGSTTRKYEFGTPAPASSFSAVTDAARRVATPLQRDETSDRPIKSRLPFWKRAMDDVTDEDVTNLEEEMSLNAKLGIGALGVTTQKREYNPASQLFSCETETPAQPVEIGKTIRNPPPKGRNGKLDPYADIDINTLVAPDAPMTTLANLGDY